LANDDRAGADDEHLMNVVSFHNASPVLFFRNTVSAFSLPLSVTDFESKHNKNFHVFFEKNLCWVTKNIFSGRIGHQKKDKENFGLTLHNI